MGWPACKVAFIRPLKDFGTQRFDIDDLVHDVEKVTALGGDDDASDTVLTVHLCAVVSDWYHVVMAMTLRLTAEQDRALELLARAEGVSKQEAAVRAISEVAARHLHDERVDELSSTARERYADLLDRLGR
jgi:uncharacterized protein (DUF1778 family)